MDRMLVVVFDNEKKAYQGKSALQALNAEGAITLYASAVVLKHADGSVTVTDSNYAPPLATLLGTSLGSFIGLIGGPAGVALGALSGLTIGGFTDADNAAVGEDFVADVGKTLTPNKVALVAEVDEEWTTPVDAKMEAIGGTVFRRALWDVQDQVDDEAIAAMKADVAQFQAELSRVNAERRKQIQENIDDLKAKINTRQAELKKAREARKSATQAKSEVLKKNAKAAGRALKELAETPV